jgi:hypothetical protein
MSTEPTMIEVISTVLGLDGLPQEERDATLVEFNAMVFRTSIITMIEQMDEETRETFAALTGGDPTEEELQAFLTAHVPNSSQIVQETIERLLRDILATTTNQ